MSTSRSFGIPGRLRSSRFGMVLALSVLFTSPLAMRAQSLAPDGPGGTIVFARADADGMPGTPFTIAADGTRMHQLLPPNFGPAGTSIDGKLVSVVSVDADGNFTGSGVVNIDGSGYQDMPAPDKTLDLGPAGWVDSSELVFQGWDDTDASRNGMYVADPSDMSALRRITANPGGGNDSPIDVSRDGSRVAFVRTPAGSDDGDLYAIGVDGTNLVRLSPAGSFVNGEGLSASWSPDGQHVAFTAHSDGGALPKVYVVDADGGNLAPVYHSGGPIDHAQWSPDGKSIAFESPEAGNPIQILTVHPDGTSLTSVTTSTLGTVSWGPRWSPDGSKLLFVTFSDGFDKADLWTADADGSNLAQLTHDPGYYGGYSWAP